MEAMLVRCTVHSVLSAGRWFWFGFCNVKDLEYPPCRLIETNMVNIF